MCYVVLGRAGFIAVELFCNLFTDRHLTGPAGNVIWDILNIFRFILQDGCVVGVIKSWKLGQTTSYLEYYSISY